MKEPLSNERIFELAKQAYKRGEFLEFLSGENEYECPLNRFVPANVPTDTERILKKGIYALYRDAGQENIIIAYRNAIIQLLGGNVIHIWIAYSICWSQLYNERKGYSPFYIITVSSGLIGRVRDALIKNAGALGLCKEYQGWNKDNGLWGDIIRTNKTLIEEFGEGIL